MKGIFPFCAVALALITFQAHSQDLCDAETSVLMTGGAEAPWTLAVDFNPKNIPLNAPFSMDVYMCNTTGSTPTRLTADATMPAHKHGMNYTPTIKKHSDRFVTVQNFLFHMPGVWQIEVTTFDGDTPHRFTTNVSLK